MAGHSGRVDQPTWDKLLEAYRDDPGNHSAAGRHAMVTRKTARRAWDLGAPGKPWGLKPISQLVAEDVELARGIVQLEQERADLGNDVAELERDRDREAARQHAVKATQQEVVMVTAARQVTMAALAGAIQASKGMSLAMARLGTELEKIAGGGPMTHKEMLALSNVGRRYASTLRELSVSAQLAMEMERLRLGEPQKIVSVETELDSLPLQDLVRMAGYQDGVLQRAAQRGLIVLDGGKK